jgi:hypothetical protein
VAIIPANAECLRAELARKSYSAELRQTFRKSLPATNVWTCGGFDKAATGLSAGTGADGGALLADGQGKPQPKRPGAPPLVGERSVQAIVVPK